MINTLLDNIGDTDEILRYAKAMASTRYRDLLAKTMRVSIKNSLMDHYGISLKTISVNPDQPPEIDLERSLLSCILEDMAKTIIDSKEGE